MITIIPLEYYTSFYYTVLLGVILFTFLHSQLLRLNDEMNLNYVKIAGEVVLIFVFLYMGLRPISGRYFGDMATYNRIFEGYANGAPILSTKDVLFHVFTKFCSMIMPVQMYFLLCAALYIIPLYLVCKKWFAAYWFYAFLFLVGAFSFWGYGTNGIRNGIAGSLFLLGISRDKRVFQILWIVLAINFHKAILLPTAGFILANLYNQPKKMIFFWIFCIPLSVIGGGFFESLFGNMGFDDNRMSYLTAGNVNDDNFSSTGFRWDFLLYSSTAVFSGWYYIVKKNYRDKIFFLLFNTYVFTNAFWILVIRANFSNRFAYLSWFMIGFVIIYPLLKQQIIPRQHQRIGLILVAYFAFTYFMNIISS